MDGWTSLKDVEDFRCTGMTRTFSPSLVWPGNYFARNRFPSKFFYKGCPQRMDSGRICAKSFESSKECPHALPSRPMYRFQLHLFDAVHGGVSPLRAQLWESGSDFLGCSPSDFALLSEDEQVFRVLSLTQLAAKCKVTLGVHKFEVRILSISFVDGRPSISIPAAITNAGTPERGGSAAASSSSSRKPPSSAKKVKMPKVSDRQQAIASARRELTLEIICVSSGESDYISDSSMSSASSGYSIDMVSAGSDSGMDGEPDSDSDTGHDPFELQGHPSEVHELFFLMENSRYLVDRPITCKSKDWVRHFFDVLPERQFRQMTRMNKNTFFDLVAMVETNPVFVNKSTHPQAPVEWQLAVTLDRLGHNGNGACLNHMIPTWGVSNGSLINFTMRVFTALDLALKDSLKWPNAVERHKMSLDFADLGFAGCVGLIDGTLLPISQRPKTNGECYFDRKSRYSLNAQVVCNHQRKILFLFTGMPGSCSDITCFRKSGLYRRFQDPAIFSAGQYLLGDSGYMNGTHIVCSFKKSQSDQDKEDFNICVAKARVTNEHCIGVLKSRWHSLKELRIQLNEPKDSTHMVRWIGMCAKLHNFVISKNDIWSDDDQEIIYDDDDVPGLESGHPLQGPTISPSMLQCRIQREALAWNRRPGGCLSSIEED